MRVDAEASMAMSGMPKSQRQRISVARSEGRRQVAATMWTKDWVPRFDSATEVDGWGREPDLGGWSHFYSMGVSLAVVSCQKKRTRFARSLGWVVETRPR